MFILYRMISFTSFKFFKTQMERWQAGKFCLTILVYGLGRNDFTFLSNSMECIKVPDQPFKER